MASALPRLTRRHPPVLAAGLIGLGLLGLPVLPLLSAGGTAHAQFAPGGRAPLSFADIVERVKPSVVSIHVTSGGKDPKVAQLPAPAPGQ